MHPDDHILNINVRAGNFSAKQGVVLKTPPTGNILYLSSEETKKYMHFKEVMVPVFGNTYPVKDRLKAMGAYWDATARLWLVPTHLLPTAQTIVGRWP